MNNINTMKKILACCFVIVLITSAAVAGTLAYEYGTFESALQMAKGDAVVSVELVWQSMDEAGNVVELADQSQRPDLMPLAAEEYSENIISVRNTGTISSYNRVIIAVPAEIDETVELIKGDDWNLTETIEEQECEGETCNVYIYTLNNALAADDTSSPVIQGVRLDKDLEQYGDTHILGNKIYDFSDGLRLKVKAQAIQSNFFTSAENAFEQVAMSDNPWGEAIPGSANSAAQQDNLETALTQMPVGEEDITAKITNVIFGKKADYAAEIEGCFSRAVDSANPNGPWAYYKADVPENANDTNIADGTTWTVYILSDEPVPVTNLSNLFSGMTSLSELDASNLDTTNVTNMENVFTGNKTLTYLNASGWDTSNVTQMDNMFQGCTALETVDASGWDTSNVTSMSFMFRECTALKTVDASGWDTSKVTSMSWMFKGCSSLTTLDVSGWDTRNVTAMGEMFQGCSSLTTLDTSKWNTSNVTNMGHIFEGCSELTTLDVSGWNTSNVTSMSCMFSGCSKLTALDVSGWDTSEVTTMENLFKDCSSLTELNVSGWDTAKVINMQRLFNGCSGLTTLDVSNWDTSRVTHMTSMFDGCSGLTVVNLFSFAADKEKVSISHMFCNCRELKTIYVPDDDTWTLAAEKHSTPMFEESKNLVGGAGTTFISTNSPYAKIDGGTSSPGYFTKK